MSFISDLLLSQNSYSEFTGLAPGHEVAHFQHLFDDNLLHEVNITATDKINKAFFIIPMFIQMYNLILKL